MARPKRLKIKKRVYRVVRCKLPDGKLGDCDPPHAKKRQIRVAINLRGKVELQTYIHEFMHGVNWPASERRVLRDETELANYIWQLGYRKSRKAKQRG